MKFEQSSTLFRAHLCITSLLTLLASLSTLCSVSAESAETPSRPTIHSFGIEGPAGFLADIARPLTLRPMSVPNATSTGDPLTYNYHPNTALGLGLGFDPSDVTVPRRKCIDAKPEVIDAGAVKTSVTMTYVRDWNQLNTAMKVDLKADASYMGAKGNASYSFDTSSSFLSNSVTVVMTASTDFGRWGLSASASLTDFASTLLKSDPQGFARICGTRFVAFERRGASVSAKITLLSVQSDVKSSWDASFGGSGNWGAVSASAQATFRQMLASAAKQDRLDIQLGSTGGIGLSGLKDSIVELANTEKDPVSAIFKSLGDSLSGFTKDNAAPIEYTAAPMDYFGFDPTSIISWDDPKELKLRALVAAYRDAQSQLDLISNMQDGTSPLLKVLDKSTTDWLITKLPGLKVYIKMMQTIHTKCMANQSVSDCDLPFALKMVPDVIISLFNPPTVQFYARGIMPDGSILDFDNMQGSVILHAAKGDRLTVARTFKPDIKSIFIGINFDEPAGLFSYQDIFQYKDGHVISNNEVGSGSAWGMGWVGEPAAAFSKDPLFPYYEGLEYKFFAQHNGNFEGDQIFKLRDKMGRTFRITIFHANWSADGQRVTTSDVQFFD